MASPQASPRQLGTPNYGSLRQLAPLTPAQPASHRPAQRPVKEHISVRFSKNLPGLLLPWFLFAVALVSCALPGDTLQCCMAVVATTFLSTGFILFSRSRPWLIVALACLLSAMLGSGLGLHEWARRSWPYSVYTRSVVYDQVQPTDASGAYQDAGLITFSSRAFVDTVKSVGFMDGGSEWCAAPIVNSSAQDLAGFWAVGVDCCGARGAFRCGQESIGKYGVVVLDTYAAAQERSSYYNALQAASAVYGIELPKRPVLVKWGTSLDKEMGELFAGVRRFTLVAGSLYLLTVPTIALLLALLGDRLLNRPAGPDWYPDQAAIMSFGPSTVQQQQYPEGLQLELLYRRAFWTGEAALDYVFHLANTSLFLGPLLCHPAHPYKRFERLVVLLIVGPPCVFLTALVRFFSDNSLLRLLPVLLLVLLERKVLRAWVCILGRKEEILLGDQVDRANALSWQAAFLGSCALVAAVVCDLCARCLFKKSEDAGDILRQSLDGLISAFVFELLIDCFMPEGEGARGWTWGIGFFGRWKAERDSTDDDFGRLGSGRQLSRKSRRSRRPRGDRGRGASYGGGASGLLVAPPPQSQSQSQSRRELAIV